MFGFTKWVKLLGLFRRNPRDVVFLPVSILFGYFHGFIKLYALFTLNMVRNHSPLQDPRDDRSLTWMSSRPLGAVGRMVTSTTRSVCILALGRVTA